MFFLTHPLPPFPFLSNFSLTKNFSPLPPLLTYFLPSSPLHQDRQTLSHTHIPSPSLFSNCPSIQPTTSHPAHYTKVVRHSLTPSSPPPPLPSSLTVLPSSSLHQSRQRKSRVHPATLLRKHQGCRGNSHAHCARLTWRCKSSPGGDGGGGQ